jgi:DNA primase
VAYAGRTILPVSDENPKWKIPAGLQRTFVYGLEKCDPAKPLILCESPWGCLWLFQHGRQAAALVACSMTSEQEKRLEPFKVIQLAFDNDQSGRDATAKIVERLRGKHTVLKSYLKE